MLRVGLVQTCTGIDPAANAATLVAAIGTLAEQGAEIIFTPEMSGLLDRNRARAAGQIRGEAEDIVLAAVRAAAARHRVCVQLGSLALRPDNAAKLVNRAFMIAADGAIVARYDKIHLFDIDLPEGETYRESATYAPGDRAVIAPMPWGGLGLTICYDVRFPSLYNGLAVGGASVIAVPAAFTRPTGVAHWHVLLRARAIETGAFIIAAAQSGEHDDGRTTFGHSLIIDPWGTVLVDMGTTPGVAIADLDLTQVQTTRTRLPSLINSRAFSPALTVLPAESTHKGRAPVAQPDRATVS